MTKLICLQNPTDVWLSGGTIFPSIELQVVNDDRQAEIFTAQPLEPEPSVS